MVFNFDTPIDRRNTGSMKWEKYKGKDIIPLWVADMDFRSPPVVIEALHNRVEHGIFGYAVSTEELLEERHAERGRRPVAGQLHDPAQQRQRQRRRRKANIRAMPPPKDVPWICAALIPMASSNPARSSASISIV